MLIVTFCCLLTDKNLMSMTGKVLMTCDLARRYGLKDVDGTEHCSCVENEL